MTELERQLTAALETLSAQYGTEQRRHCEQVEACGCGSSSRPRRAKPCRSKSSGSPSK